MKSSGFLTAAVAASVTASAAAVSASSLSFSVNVLPLNHHHHQDEVESSCKDNIRAEVSSNSSTEKKFAPRFDGLRFIETLITAHR